MHVLSSLFTGAFLLNAIPHLSNGLSGRAFPTPFARPRGVGVSSAVSNVLWGAFNLSCGMVLLAAFPIAVGLTPDFALAGHGALALGVYLALHFGRLPH